MTRWWWLYWYFLWLIDYDMGDDCVYIIRGWLMMTRWWWLCWHYRWLTEDDRWWWLCCYYLWVTGDDEVMMIVLILFCGWVMMTGGCDCVDIMCGWLIMTGVMIVLTLFVGVWWLQGWWLCWHYLQVTGDDGVMMIVLILLWPSDDDMGWLSWWHYVWLTDDDRGWWMWWH